LFLGFLEAFILFKNFPYSRNKSNKIKNENKKKFEVLIKRTNYKYHDVEYHLLLNNYSLLREVFIP